MRADWAWFCRRLEGGEEWARSISRSQRIANARPMTGTAMKQSGNHYAHFTGLLRGVCHRTALHFNPALQRLMFANIPHHIGRYVVDVADTDRTAVTLYSQFLGRRLPKSGESIRHNTILSRFVYQPTHHHPWALFLCRGRFRVSAARHDCPRERCPRELPNSILLILRVPPKHWSASPRCSPR
jgi:hypothetical protein